MHQQSVHKVDLRGFFWVDVWVEQSLTAGQYK